MFPWLVSLNQHLTEDHTLQLLPVPHSLFWATVVGPPLLFHTVYLLARLFWGLAILPRVYLLSTSRLHLLPSVRWFSYKQGAGSEVLITLKLILFGKNTSWVMQGASFVSHESHKCLVVPLLVLSRLVSGTIWRQGGRVSVARSVCPEARETTCYHEDGEDALTHIGL